MSFFIWICVMFLSGMLVSRICRTWFYEPMGRARARTKVYLVGSGIVITSTVITIILYLEWFGMETMNTWAHPLNLFIVQEPRNFWNDLGAFIIILLYPVMYTAAAEFEMKVSTSRPTIGKPIDLKNGRSIIIIADTHLGLRPNIIDDICDRGSACDTNAVSSFADWLVRTTNGPRKHIGTIPIWTEQGSIEKKELKQPEYLVLLGDILEMWDGWEESVTIDMATTFSKFNHLGCQTRVIYVAGNHDQVLEKDRTRIERDKATFVIARDIWPGPEEHGGRDVHPIKAGERQYLFLHGHQFGWLYRNLGPLMHIPGHIRRAAQLGHYTWVLLLMMLGLVVFEFSFSGQTAPLVVIWFMLFFFLIPLIAVTLGRMAYEFISDVKHDNKKGLKSFGIWWRTRMGRGWPEESKNKPSDDLAIVYGHTHISDVVDMRTARSRGYAWTRKWRDETNMPLMLNLPSWTKDFNKTRERAVMLYIDDEGYLFLGWDWTYNWPFHIPENLIVQLRTARADVDRNVENFGLNRQALMDLGWPPLLITKWFKDIKQEKLS